MKDQISALELYHLTREFQVFKEGRIDKLYFDEGFLLMQIYTPGLRSNLVLDIPNAAFITDKKPSFNPPSNYCMYLRKRLTKARILDIEQLRFDRILLIRLLREEKEFRLYAEFFGKGNLVLTDENDVIISAMNSITFKDRSLKKGETYSLPPEQSELHEMSREEFEVLLGDNPEKVLATKLGLGKDYASYIAGKKDLFAAIRELLDNPKPQLSEEGAFIAPIVKGESTTSFSEAIAKVRLPLRKDEKKEERLSIANKKLGKHEKILRAQEENIERQSRLAEEYQRKGELLYEHYKEVSDLLEEFKKDRKEMDEKSLKEKYKENPLVKKLTRTSLTIELEEQ